METSLPSCHFPLGSRLHVATLLLSLSFASVIICNFAQRVIRSIRSIRWIELLLPLTHHRWCPLPGTHYTSHDTDTPPPPLCSMVMMMHPLWHMFHLCMFHSDTVTVLSMCVSVRRLDRCTRAFSSPCFVSTLAELRSWSSPHLYACSGALRRLNWHSDLGSDSTLP